MRTKTMILSATCGLLGALAAQADSVYSVNVVGYVNKTLAANSWQILANPLNGADNSISNLFLNLTDADGGTEIYAYNTSTYGYDNYYFTGVQGGWINADSLEDANSTVLAPGQSFWFHAAKATTVTFVGNVLTGSLSLPVVTGWSLIASQVPVAGSLVTQGLQGAADDNIYKVDPNGGWINWFYIAGAGWLNADSLAYEDPTVDVGEGFWYQTKAGFTWSRTFTVSTN